MTDRGLGLAAAVMGPVCWSIGGVLIRLLPLEPWTIVAGRALAFVAVMSLVLAWRTRGRPWRAVASLGWQGLLAGICFCGAFVFYILSVSTTTVAAALALQGTSPAFAALIAFLFMGERPRWSRLVSIGAVMVAIVYMMRASAPGNLLGELAGILCGFSFAAGVVLVRAAGGRDSYAMIWWAGLISAVTALPFARDFALVGGREIAIFALLGAVQLALGFVCFTWGAARIPAAQAALIALLEDVLGPLWVFLIVAETPDAPTLIGMAIILGAVVFDAVTAERRLSEAATA